jgi:outer membrane protein OmpA-like peptidoglycan-associated protein
MRQSIRFLVVGAALSLVGTGCARMQWTRELVAKRQVEVDERFRKVETDVRGQRERIDQVEVQVAHLDSTLMETRELIRTVATQAAPAAAARNSAAEPRASQPPSDRPARPARTLVAVVHVPFGFDRAELDAAAEATVATILKELRENPNLTIDLEGSTDAAGRLDYNLRLSQRRVEAVRRWLVRHGMESTRIVDAKARGPLASVSVKDDLKRRVMVKLMSSRE